jgi:hypothetical protein
MSNLRSVDASPYPWSLTPLAATLIDYVIVVRAGFTAH